MKRRAQVLPNRASAARSAAGRPGKKTSDSALAASNGTRLILEERAPSVCTSGLTRSAFPVAAGRHIRSVCAMTDFLPRTPESFVLSNGRRNPGSQYIARTELTVLLPVISSDTTLLLAQSA